MSKDLYMMENRKQLMVALSVAFALGFATIISVLRWVLYYRGGLAWDGGEANFNWHPVLQLSGFIFLTGIAMISFRYPWTQNLSRETVKYIHAGLNMIALTCAVISLRATFGSQKAFEFPNMFSLHSWLGFTVVVLFTLQIALSVCLYLLPITPDSYKAAFLPFHMFLGRLLFGGSIAVSLMGITERMIYGLTDPKYTDSPPEALFVNVMGLLLVAYGVAVLWISTHKPWKRPGDPDWLTNGQLADKIK